MADKRELGLNPGVEKTTLSEEELIESEQAVISALLAGIKLFGAAEKEQIANVLDYKANKGLEKHLSGFPGANRNYVKQTLEGIITELKGKS